MLKVKQESSNPGIRVVGDRILVRTDAIEEKTEGGIVIPLSAKEKHEMATCYGTVVGMGPDCYIYHVEVTERRMGNGDWREVERKTRKHSEPFCKLGDRVAFAAYAGLQQIGEDGASYKTMNDGDITAIVSEKVTQTTLEARKPLSG